MSSTRFVGRLVPILSQMSCFRLWSHLPGNDEPQETAEKNEDRNDRQASEYDSVICIYTPCKCVSHEDANPTGRPSEETQNGLLRTCQKCGDNATADTNHCPQCDLQSSCHAILRPTTPSPDGTSWPSIFGGWNAPVGCVDMLGAFHNFVSTEFDVSGVPVSDETPCFRRVVVTVVLMLGRHRHRKCAVRHGQLLTQVCVVGCERFKALLDIEWVTGCLSVHKCMHRNTLRPKERPGMPRMPRPMGNLFIGILLWHIATNHTHEDSSSARNTDVDGPIFVQKNVLCRLTTALAAILGGAHISWS